MRICSGRGARNSGRLGCFSTASAVSTLAAADQPLMPKNGGTLTQPVAEETNSGHVRKFRIYQHPENYIPSSKYIIVNPLVTF